MQKVPIFDNLEQVKHSGIGTCLVLYSGGLDGSYLLSEAQALGIQPIALCIGVNNDPANPVAERHARLLGVPYFYQNRTKELVDEFIARGIQANAYYRGFPIASSFSRPMIARAGVEFARQRGLPCIGHTSVANQNSAARFNYSLMALAPEIPIAAPFLRTQVAREQKLSRLKAHGLRFASGIYSVDENLWARVIECGTLEDPENDLPPDGVFRWTRDVDQTPSKAEIVGIAFENGLPVALNGARAPLQEVIQALNTLGGRHGVGRFSGLEDTLFGVKNHEVREAPAAHILLRAHQELEAAVLTRGELALKNIVDQSFNDLAVAGHWFSDAAEAAMAFIERLNVLIHGSVRIQLHRGNLTVLSRQAEAGLYYPAFAETFFSLVQDTPWEAVYNLMALPSMRRQRLTATDPGPISTETE